MKLLKLLILTAAISFSTLAFAQNSQGGSDIGSAFVSGDTLYVTILGDCNTMMGTLTVEPTCRQGRMTANWATVCDATLHVRETKKGCPVKAKPTPKVLEISLQGSKVAREAELLNLSIADKVIEVRIK